MKLYNIIACELLLCAIVFLILQNNWIMLMIIACLGVIVLMLAVNDWMKQTEYRCLVKEIEEEQKINGI